MKKLIYICINITVLSLCFSFISCKKKPEETNIIKTEKIELNKTNHTWYYFTQKEYQKIDKIQYVPKTQFIPWTEAVQISSANSSSFSGEDHAYAVVNRLGILSFDGENISLSKDENIFTDRTAGNLNFFNGTPVFSVFKSAFFNDTIKDYDYKQSDSQHLFLIQFDTISKISYPLVNCNNLTKESNSEVTDFSWDGINWNCCIKTISESKTNFSYVNWKPVSTLLTLSPITANSNISITESNQDEFRSKKEIQDYKASPERIKNLLSGFSGNTNFQIEVKTSGGSSSRIFENIVSSETSDKPLFATAILAQSWSAALFEDGTLFLEGALPGKHILRNGKPVAVRLPKLPADFVYSHFIISGTTLYAGWEENAFFKTGRSGFIQVNLDKTLYSKLL